jgi:hypothetical protein
LWLLRVAPHQTQTPPGPGSLFSIVKIAFSSVLFPLLFACSHPLEIIGDVLSASGERNCYLADFKAGKDNCRKNLIMSAYQETYYGVAHKGWKFSHWQNYCTDASNNQCSWVYLG